jgi:hypothetical protein
MTWTAQETKEIREDIQTHRQKRYLIRLLLFFQNKETELKVKLTKHHTIQTYGEWKYSSAILYLGTNCK